MKRTLLYLTAVVMAAATLCSSCSVGDNDKEEDEIKNDMSFIYMKASRITSKNGSLPADPDWNISKNVVAKETNASEDADATGIKGKISELFKESDQRTTIYGYSDSEFMSITYNGKDSKEYSFKQTIGEDVNAMLLEYLTTGTLTDEMANKFGFDALIIYKGNKSADAKSENFWFSNEVTVNPSSLKVQKVAYIQGTFAAKMTNVAGDMFIFTDGAFSCLGI